MTRRAPPDGASMRRPRLGRRLALPLLLAIALLALGQCWPGVDEAPQGGSTPRGDALDRDASPGGRGSGGRTRHPTLSGATSPEPAETQRGSSEEAPPRATPATGDEDTGPVGAVAALRIVLDVPDAWRVGKQHVYALPAGGAGVDDLALIPHAEVRGASVMLSLPSDGLWDIGYRSPLGQTLQTDVDAATTRTLRLVAAGAAPIRIRLGDALPPPADLARLHVRVRALEDRPDAEYPGRGERCRLRPDCKLDAGGRGATPPLPARLPFRVTVWGGPLRAGDIAWAAPQDTAYAGQEVTLRAGPVGEAVVALSLAEPLPAGWTAAWKTDIWAAVRAEAPGDDERRHRYASTWLRADGTFKDAELHLPLAPGGYVLRSGFGRTFHEQTLALEIVAGAVVRVPLALVPDRSFRPFGSGEPEPSAWGVHTRWEVSGAREGRLQVFLETRDDEGQPLLEEHGGRLPEEQHLEIMTLAPPGVAQAFRYPDRASPPFQVPARGAGAIRLVPAGLLVVVPERVPDASLGRLHLRRRDGRPLPYVPTKQGAGDKVEVARRVTVGVGTRLGPLPAGRHTFDVLLGGVVIGQASAVVRGGAITPLAVPGGRAANR